MDETDEFVPLIDANGVQADVSSIVSQERRQQTHCRDVCCSLTLRGLADSAMNAAV